MANPTLNSYLLDHPISLVDVGAKGGITDLLRLAPYCEVYGIEPNPGEYNQLRIKKHHPYRKETYLDVALSDFEGEAELNISRNSSFSSLLRTDWANYQRYFGFIPNAYDWRRKIETLHTIKVKVTTLDTTCKTLGINQIDFLKLDTQGTELSILNGAIQLLKSQSIGVIKCEVSFIPVYQEQAVFSNIDLFLKEHHFQFVDCLFYKGEIYEKLQTKLIDTPVSHVHEPIRYSAGGDAIWVVDFTKMDRKNRPLFALKSGIILAELAYYGLAYHTLKNHAELGEEEIKRFFEYFSRKPLKRR